jgi:integrase
MTLKKLEDAMDIMLGTSVRVGEVMALRRQDDDVVSDVPSLLIDGTLRQTRAEGLHRKDSAKHMRQRRRVVLPDFTVAAVTSRLELAGPAAGDYLFATATGRPYSISNFEWLMRGFVGAHSQTLRSAGINVEEFSTHIFRRTAATIVEQGWNNSLVTTPWARE